MAGEQTGTTTRQKVGKRMEELKRLRDEDPPGPPPRHR